MYCVVNVENIGAWLSKTIELIYKLLSSIVKAMFLKKTAQDFEECINRNVLELSMIIIIIIIIITIITIITIIIITIIIIKITIITDIIIIMTVIIIVIVTMIVVIIKI